MAGDFAFVSYSHDDLGYVRRLVTSLDRRGAAVWHDERIPTGELWETLLRHRIADCTAMIVVMSPAAAASEWVQREVELARTLGKPIRPLLLAGNPLDSLKDVQYEPVLARQVPSADFVNRLPHQPGGAVAPAPTRLIGSLPGEADCFQARNLLGLVEEALATRKTAVMTQVLTGLGGVGKTQLAAALCRLFLDSSLLGLLLWVSARDQATILSSYARAGHEMCGADEGDPERAARAFLEWLATTPDHWMVVLDDVADPADLVGWWPPESSTGRTVITTRLRDAAMASHGQLISVGTFTIDEARTYLRTKFADQPERLDEADQMADDVGYLPLMLSQAAAFIHNHPTLTCAGYRDRLRNAGNLADVVPEDRRLPDDYQHTVAVSLLLSLEAANQMRPAGLAGPLLNLLSVLDPNGVPHRVLTTEPALTYLTKRQGAADAESVLDGLGVLAQFNLIDVASPSGRLADAHIRVHGLVQHATRDHLGADAHGELVTAAADALLTTWPRIQRDADLTQALRANTAALRSVAGTVLIRPDVHDLLQRAGQSLGESGLVAAAIDYFEKLRAQVEADHGSDHPSVLACRLHVASWRAAAGDLAVALTECEALLVDALRALGSDHPGTLTVRNNLATFQGQAGDAAGALAAFETLLPDRQRILGPDHRETLITHSNLAEWLGFAVGPSEAAAALEALQEAFNDALGPDHLDTLILRSNLATWSGRAGDAARAIAILEDLQPDIVRELGPDHPEVLVSRHNLAGWRASAGDLTGAITAFEEVLADRERVLGSDHPDALSTRNELAFWQGLTGNAADAIAALETLRSDSQRVLAANHPLTLSIDVNLGIMRGLAGERLQAISALEAILPSYEGVFGPSHPRTRFVREQLDFWSSSV